MAELKNMTVQALRELARKALGRGHSRLRTKSELVAALQSAERRVTRAAEQATARVKAVTARAAKAAGEVLETATGKRARAAKSAAAKGATQATAGARKGPAKAAQGAAKGVAKKEAAPARRPPAKKAKGGAARVEEEAALEPDPDGYFVARVRGEDEARDAPHPRTEAAQERLPASPPRAGLRPEAWYDEQLGELPWAYGDDAFIALPRDPQTLFLYWDHAEDTVRRGWEGLEGGRPQLWIYAQGGQGEWERVRTIEFALESRSYYVHDLAPGRPYRAEIHIVDRGGRDQRLGAVSNATALPSLGPSPIVDDRFMRIPWGEPLQALLRHVREGGPFPDELRAQFARLSDWGRFTGGPGGSSGGVGGPGRPTSSSMPTSPGGPPGRGEGR